MSKVVKQSGPTTLHGRPIVYDREIAISICRKILLRQDLQTICAKPPMPIGQVFLGWVQDHPEARAIYRSVRNFRSDRELAREVDGVPARASVAEWEEEVRANCERGWPADWIERKYTPPDWNKVYRQLGGPPVWSTEDIEAYTELLNDFTERLEPLDTIELIWTKEAADATWEAARFSREKNSLPEQKYQERRRVLAQLARRTGADGAKPASAFDHSLGLQAGCKYYQPFDIGQSRAIKRRDNALRQIARWRDGLGAKARRLSDKFIAEQALVERYGATELLADAEADAIAGDSVQAALSLASPDEAADAAPPVPPADRAAEAAPSLASAPEPLEPAAPLRISDEAAAKQIARHLPADTESDGTAGDAMQVGPPLASAGDAADPAPPVPLADGAVGDARWLASSSETAEIAAPLRASDVVVDAAPPVAPGAEPTRDASPPAFTGEGTDAAPAPQGAPPDEAAEAAPPHAPADDEPIPELAHYLPAIAQAAPTVAASAEAPQ